MIAARWPERAIYFVACLFVSRHSFDEALAGLCRSFGPVLFCSDSYAWTRSDYYNEEMGAPLLRRFVFFSRVSDTTRLVQAKGCARAVEECLSADGRRTINLDPGYLTLAKVVLASRKNYSHRICIGEGVFAELELYCEAGGFRPLSYTYFDYREERCLKIFNGARQQFKKLLQETDFNPAAAAD